MGAKESRAHYILVFIGIILSGGTHKLGLLTEMHTWIRGRNNNCYKKLHHEQ